MQLDICQFLERLAANIQGEELFSTESDSVKHTDGNALLPEACARDSPGCTADEDPITPPLAPRGNMSSMSIYILLSAK